MTRIKQLKIWTLCILLVLESILFINTGITQNYDIAIIGGADGPTHIYLSPTHGKELKAPAEDQVEKEDRVRQEAAERGLLVLVNKENQVNKDYKPEDLEPIRYFASDRSPEGRYMRAEAAEYFHKMVDSAKEEGYTLKMTTAYRSYGFQQILWNNYVAREGEEEASRFSARPGQSEHQTGLAVDVTSPAVDEKLTNEFGETPEGLWLAGNAHRFGFILRYPKEKEHITGYLYEPWHFRYVGEKVATEIYEKGLTLEEYISR